MWKSQNIIGLFTQSENNEGSGQDYECQSSDDGDIQVIEHSNISIRDILGQFKIGRKMTADSISPNTRYEEDYTFQITEWDHKILSRIQKNKPFNFLNKPKLQFTIFPNLSILNLSSNYIVSLQFITWISAPNLQKLILTDNMINSIRSLRKCQMDNLTQLILDVNQIFDVDTLTQMRAARLAKIRMDRFQQDVFDVVGNQIWSACRSWLKCSQGIFPHVGYKENLEQQTKIWKMYQEESLPGQLFPTEFLPKINDLNQNTKNCSTNNNIKLLNNTQLLLLQPNMINQNKYDEVQQEGQHLDQVQQQMRVIPPSTPKDQKNHQMKKYFLILLGLIVFLFLVNLSVNKKSFNKQAMSQQKQQLDQIEENNQQDDDQQEDDEQEVELEFPRKQKKSTQQQSEQNLDEDQQAEEQQENKKKLKKQETKKQQPKKEEAKKQQPKKEATKKQQPKKQQPKKEEAKKQQQKKEEAKKQQPKKETKAMEQKKPQQTNNKASSLRFKINQKQIAFIPNIQELKDKIVYEGNAMIDNNLVAVEVKVNSFKNRQSYQQYKKQQGERKIPDTERQIQININE